MTVRGFLKDVEHGRRVLWHAGTLAPVAVIVMALGLSVAGVAFELLLSVLSPGVPSPDTLAKVGVRSPLGLAGVGPAPVHVIGELTRQATSFVAVSGVTDYTATVDVEGVDGVSVPVEVAEVSPGFFGLAEAAPLLGRTFDANDHLEGAQHVIVISHHVWGQLFLRDAAVIGRRVMLATRVYVVVGVMPKGFSFPMSDVWVPATGAGLSLDATKMAMIYVRLRQGVSWDGAKSDIARLSANLRATYPAEFRDKTLGLLTAEAEAASRQGKTTLLLLGPSSLLLLASCLVVGNLLLGVAIAREKEMGVRLALGATRLRLVRQLLTEGAMIAMPACAIALLLVVVEVGLIRALSAPQVQWATASLRVGPSTFAFILGVSLLAPLIFGLVPAVYSFRTSLLVSMQQTVRTARAGLGRYTARDLLVILQVSASVIILAALAVIRSAMWLALDYDYGFNVDHLVVVRATIVKVDKRPQLANTLFLQRRDIVDRMVSIPGVRSVAVVDSPPGPNQRRLGVSSAPPSTSARTDTAARCVAIDGGFFRTLGVRVAPRPISTEDVQNRLPVAVVSAALANLLWPNVDSIGQTIFISDRVGENSTPLTVVGVASDTVYSHLHPESRLAVYFPLSLFNTGTGDFTFIAAVEGDARTVAPWLRSAVAQIGADWNVDRPRPYREAAEMTRTIQGVMFFLRVFGAVAAVTLFVAIVGIVSVTIEAVRTNRHELGIRAAFGASPQRLVRLVMKQAAIKILVGVALGLPGPVLYNVLNPPVDLVDARLAIFGNPVSWAIVLGAIGLIVLGGYLGAREASRSDPAVLMRDI